MKISQKSQIHLLVVLMTNLIIGINSSPLLGQAFQQVMYVDASVSNSGDGSSWEQAYKHIDEALMVSTTGSNIWVKSGTYHLRSFNNSYLIPAGVSIYGGFSEGDIHPAARTNFGYKEENETILVGDFISPSDTANYNLFDGISLYTDHAIGYSTIIVNALIATESQAPVRYYVDGDLSTNGSGSSWSSAFNNLVSALAVAKVGDDIWIKGGEYKFNSNVPSGGDGITFQVPSGVSLYGGFSGNETNLNQRVQVELGEFNPNETHFVGYGEYTAALNIKTNTAFQVNGDAFKTVFDGLVITGSDAYGGETGGVVGDNILFENCWFDKNIGHTGGAYRGNNSKFSNCHFLDNDATFYGALTGDNIQIENSSFIFNFSNEYGTYSISQMSLTNSLIVNCTFGGTLYYSSASDRPEYDEQYCSFKTTQISNSIFAYNGGTIRFIECDLKNTQFTGNQIGNYRMNNSTVDNCDFYDNHHPDGRFFLFYEGTEVSNCDFYNNSTEHSVLSLWGSDEKNSKLINCNFFENFGGASCWPYAEVDNCNFTNNGSINISLNGDVKNTKISNNGSIDVNLAGQVRNSSFSDNEYIHLDSRCSPFEHNKIIGNGGLTLTARGTINNSFILRNGYDPKISFYRELEINHLTLVYDKLEPGTADLTFYGDRSEHVKMTNSIIYCPDLSTGIRDGFSYNAGLAYELGENSLILDPENANENGAQIAFDTLMLPTSVCIGAGNDGSNIGAYQGSGDGLSRVFFPLKDGDWEDGEVWNYGIPPLEGFDVVISGQSVSLNSETKCGSLEIKQADNAKVGELMVNKGGHLKVIEYLEVEEQAIGAAQLNQLYVMPGGQVEILEEE